MPPLVRERLDLYARLVADENTRQNLVAASTIADFERRHIADSLQLLPLLQPGSILDIGSGAGLPGIVLACVTEDVVHLVEPRSKRAAFLVRAAEELALQRRIVVHQKVVGRLSALRVANIVSRAVSSIDALFAMATDLSDHKTRWILPKGRSARTELEAASRSWQGDFRLVDSLTDPSASILVAERVSRRRA
jgi:16S rRNA (guanine527-N7)-methyltransferase